LPSVAHPYFVLVSVDKNAARNPLRFLAAYGLYQDEFGADEMASEIIEWWNLKLAERIQ
jgi:hypothetical protein